MQQQSSHAFCASPSLVYSNTALESGNGKHYHNNFHSQGSRTITTKPCLTYARAELRARVCVVQLYNNTKLLCYRLATPTQKWAMRSIFLIIIILVFKHPSVRLTGERLINGRGIGSGGGREGVGGGWGGKLAYRRAGRRI